ncbi:hypothetical protein HGRIS_003147 [Hohenbuehelia grisea]|uniref:Uncharacterized protein n=1 Tax=Hohenbuehelia grisea TaxID=104357 RepID=A0ABR3JMK5_9AGAR
MFIRSAAFLTLLATSVLASPGFQPTRTTPLESDLLNTWPKRDAAPAPVPENLTNAERFARGLPPKAPVWRRKHGSDLVKRLTASPMPIILTSGRISCTRVSDGVPLHLKASSTSFGLYGTSEAEDLIVKIDLAAASQGSVDMIVTNGGLLSTYPYVGGILVADTISDLGLSRSKFVYIGGTTRTEPGSPASLGPNSVTSLGGFQSAMWQYNPVSGQLIPVWVNSDGSKPLIHVFYTPSDYFVMTGDPQSLLSQAPEAEECILGFTPIIQDIRVI